MPYMKKGKCVYKKNQDGSKGKKVGCTEGSVDDYLKALYANVDDATKKESKTMKIKKSALLDLIKEEIMSEMDGLTMMDDPYDDDAVPAGMEQGGAMDQVAQEMERMVMTQVDHAISMLSNYLVTAGASSDPMRMASMGMDMLEQAGFSPPDMTAIERMIAADDGIFQEGTAEPVMESPELANINAENIMIFKDAMAKMAPLIGTMSLPVLIGMIYEQLTKMGAK